MSNEKLRETKKPVLGICLGMQFLLDSSEEDQEGKVKGLGVIPGSINKLSIQKYQCGLSCSYQY